MPPYDPRSPAILDWSHHASFLSGGREIVLYTDIYFCLRPRHPCATGRLRNLRNSESNRRLTNYGNSQRDSDTNSSIGTGSNSNSNTYSDTDTNADSNPNAHTNSDPRADAWPSGVGAGREPWFFQRDWEFGDAISEWISAAVRPGNTVLRKYASLDRQ